MVIVFFITTIYASIDGSVRRNFRNYLVRTSCNVSIPCLVMANFNSILNAQERVGDSEVRPLDFVDFYDCITITSLLDMRYT